MGLPPRRQALLFDDNADKAERQQQDLAELVDRLSSRLGRQAVVRCSLRPDGQPEHAFLRSPWLDPPPADFSVSTKRVSDSVFGPSLHSQLRYRPLRLLCFPQRLSVDVSACNGLPVRANQSPVVRISGPERIETGWWRGPDVRRDYYRLELATGAVWWTFQDRITNDWFLHGLFV